MFLRGALLLFGFAAQTVYYNKSSLVSITTSIKALYKSEYNAFLQKLHHPQQK